MFIAICLSFLSVLPFASADEWTKSFPVQNVPKLRVETSDANLRVTASESKVIEVRVTTANAGQAGTLVTAAKAERPIAW